MGKTARKRIDDALCMISQPAICWNTEVIEVRHSVEFQEKRPHRQIKINESGPKCCSLSIRDTVVAAFVKTNTPPYLIVFDDALEGLVSCWSLLHTRESQLHDSMAVFFLIYEFGAI